MKTKRINYDDDLVIVYTEDGTEIYRGLEDYEPMKYASWRWSKNEECYVLYDHDGNRYTKICLDI